VKRKIALGPGAASLILIVVILSLCMLSMLMQISARNDVSLATRSTGMITNVYNLFSHSEQRLAKLDAFLLRCRQASGGDADTYLELVENNLPEGFILTDNAGEKIISWTDPLDKRVLTCAVRLKDIREAERVEWIRHTFEEPAPAAEDEEEFL